ncbi:MAG: adenylate kinase [Gemmatimonadetes bacterium]|nr:adenylate kinase [Gemmatimonadota bacterium]
MAQAIVLLGPPGVGKGTQAARLKETVAGEHLSTGDLLREAVRSGSDLGRQAAGYMQAGELVPDEVIIGLMQAYLEAGDPGRGVIFDGFPRTVEQADGLEDALSSAARELDLVILLDADGDLIAERLAGRRSCPGCGTVFHVTANPPAREGVCDDCGSVLVRRPDDEPGTVRNRLAVYSRQTEPLIRYYERHPAGVVRIDASKGVDEVTDALRSLVETAGVRVGAEVAR